MSRRSSAFPADVDVVFAGGCTSSYEALSQGTPVVSTPTDALRGRFTYAMLRQFGLLNFIASQLSDLAALAVEVNAPCHYPVFILSSTTVLSSGCELRGEAQPSGKENVAE